MTILRVASTKILYVQEIQINFQKISLRNVLGPTGNRTRPHQHGVADHPHAYRIGYISIMLTTFRCHGRHVATNMATVTAKRIIN